jgi:signal transduction histidine kinase
MNHSDLKNQNYPDSRGGLMPVTDTKIQTVAAPPSVRRSVPRSSSWAQGKSDSWLFALGVALGVGVVSFLATELMHYLLVPDLGRSRERFLAEGFSAFIVACLIAKLAQITRRQHQITAARMQVIAEMNHHIRNALTVISLSADVIDDQHLIRVISEGIERIDWALKEILPREVPLRKEERHSLGYFQHEGTDPHDEH